MRPSFSKIVTVVAAVARCSIAASVGPSLQVETDGGILEGFVDLSTPLVRQFLGVPFAQPPLGPLRWLPPAAVASNSSSITNATSIGPSCPQLPHDTGDVFSPSGGGQTEYFPVGNFSEDCLTLNVWAPASNQTELLPVIVWFFGGGFDSGGTDSLYFNPEKWVQRSQAHIVVTVNFRSNIFGFPNAIELEEQNLGLLDQRASLEWVRQNIVAFGGDAARIVAWGQSAGAIAIDYLQFAFPDEPIVQAVIMDSGTALYPAAAAQTSDTAQTNFAEVAVQLGCGSAASQIDCLREASWQSIEAVLSANSSLKFVTVPDELVVFDDYVARYDAGHFARIPALMGTNLHEFNSGIPGQTVFNQTLSDVYTKSVFLCTAAQTSRLRNASGLTTYRYRYDGNFTDVSPPGYPGAYHASELSILFGTYGQFHGSSTDYEGDVSHVMQDLWLAFAQDPENGLKEFGWDTLNLGEAVILGGLSSPVVKILVDDLDNGC